MTTTRESLGSRPANRSPQRFELSDLRIDESKRRRRGAKWLRWVAAVLVAVLIFGAVEAWRGRPPLVETASARKAGSGPAAVLNASGYVTPRRRATVAAKITGRLNQVLVEEGMRVEAGQELANLDDTDARVRLSSAEAERDATRASLKDLQVNLENAQRELARAEQLRNQGISTPQAVDLARTAVESFRARIDSVEQQVHAAEARIQVARQDLENCVIRAPFSGMVVSKDAQRGEIVSPMSAGGSFTRTGIATIVDMSSLEIEVDVNESYIARVKPGQPVTAVLDAYPDWRIPARVRTIIPTADRQKATVKVRIAFDKLDARILPDMGVKVSFLDQHAKQTSAGTSILVPPEAVQQDQGQAIVFVVRENRVERRAVGLGAVKNGEQEIVAGLADGDVVVVKSPQALRDGQAVRVQQ
ncbi:MAG: efflux RND transporter periplasmic adaptor subunit [Acidobacteria bacterium]|nr:efflux RND transporter periplasmic adaptor subunit [Acidobacteriota bacterium]